MDKRRDSSPLGEAANGPLSEIPPFRRVRRGFRGITLIELLVVMSIIATLAALVLPAVQMARESANNTWCINNLRDMGFAVVGHEDSKNRLPNAGGLYSNTDRKSWGWLWQIIPYSNDNERLLLELSPAECARARVGFLFCPSRGKYGWYTKNGAMAGVPEFFGQTDYAGNLGWNWYLHDGSTTVPAGAGPLRPSRQLTGGLISSQISDGAGHTILAGEKFVSQEQIRTAEAGPGAKLGWTASAYDSSLGPGLSDTLRCFRGPLLGVHESHPVTEWHSPDPPDDPPLSAQLLWGSAHPNGVNFLFVSGKVVHVSRDTSPEILRAWAGANEGVRIDGAPP